MADIDPFSPVCFYELEELYKDAERFLRGIDNVGQEFLADADIDYSDKYGNLFYDLSVELCPEMDHGCAEWLCLFKEQCIAGLASILMEMGIVVTENAIRLRIPA